MQALGCKIRNLSGLVQAGLLLLQQLTFGRQPQALGPRRGLR